MNRISILAVAVIVPLLVGAFLLGAMYAGDGVVRGVRAQPLATEYPVATCNQAGFVAAYSAAQADPGAAVVTFDVCPTPALINLNTELIVSSDVEIDGAARIYLRASNNNRLFTVQNGGIFTLTQVALQNGTGQGGAVRVQSGGTLVARGALFANNRASGVAENGGAIYASGAEVTLINSTLISNTAASSGGAAFFSNTRVHLENVRLEGNSASFLGTLYASGGDIDIVNSRFLSNTTGSEGGGAYLSSATQGAYHATITGSAFSGNVAGGHGGGLYAGGMSLTISNTLFYSNTGRYGGGMRLSDSSGEVVHTLFLSNTTVPQNGDGGGIHLYDSEVRIDSSQFLSNTAYAGGGIAVYSTSTKTVVPHIVNSTFAGNEAYSGAGVSFFKAGFAANPYTAAVENSTFHRNGLNRPASPAVESSKISLFLRHVTLSESAIGVRAVSSATVTVRNSIVDSPTVCQVTNASAAFSFEYSMLDGTTCGGIGAGTITGNDPLLLPLQNNGGPTLTQRLDAGSLAIDSAVTTSCTPADQRGAPRPYGAGCDMGALEVSTITLPTATPTPTPETPTPIATFDLTGTPDGTPEETPSLTPESTVTPVVSPSPEASQTPDASTTPGASLTPAVTLTPGASPTPNASATPQPTLNPDDVVVNVYLSTVNGE